VKDGIFLAGSSQLGILDEEWMVNSSPNIMLLNPKQSSSFGLDSDGEVEEAQATPSKPSRKHKQQKKEG